jgi:hypothetical protein
MPRLHVLDNSKLRAKAFEELKKLRKDRKNSFVLYYVTCAMLGLNTIMIVINVWVHHWQTILYPLAGNIFLYLVLRMNKTYRRAIVRQAHGTRAYLKFLKHIEYVDISVEMGIAEIPAPEKPKVH